MPDRPSFPIPEEIDPPQHCLQLCIPNDPTWKAVIAGLLWQPAEWFNWQRDDEKSGKELAQVWRKIYAEIDWSDMSCCCPEPTPKQYRWTDDGHYQTSDDGGVTWVDAPTEDPRYSVPLFPPLLPPDTVDNKCTYADSIVAIWKEDFVDAMEVGDSAAQILALVSGIILAVLGAIVAPLVIVLFNVVVPAIFAFGIEAFKAAYTEDVWNRLRCLLKDNMQEDGSFTQENVDAIYENIEETGIVLYTLRQLVATHGAQGLTNAARSGRGAPDAECDCDESCNPEIWTIGNLGFTPFGTILEYGENYLIGEAQLYAGYYYLTMVTPSNTEGCCIESVEVLEGEGPPPAFIQVPNPQEAAYITGGNPLCEDAGLINYLAYGSVTTYFKIKVTFF